MQGFSQFHRRALSRYGNGQIASRCHCRDGFQIVSDFETIPAQMLKIFQLFDEALLCRSLGTSTKHGENQNRKKGRWTQ